MVPMDSPELVSSLCHLTLPLFSSHTDTLLSVARIEERAQEKRIADCEPEATPCGHKYVAMVRIQTIL